MILLDKKDVVIKVALSVIPPAVPFPTILLKNVQTKVVTTHPMYDVTFDNCRTRIYQFYVVGSQPVPSLPHTTILNLQDGVYEYEFGGEIGLLQIGIPTLDKIEYNHQGQNNIVYEA